MFFTTTLPRRALWPLVFFGLLAPRAQASEQVDVGYYRLGMALGYGYAESPYADIDDIPLPVIPLIAYYGENWFFDNFLLGYALYENDGFLIDAEIYPNLDGLYATNASGNDIYFITEGGLAPTLPGAPPPRGTISKRVELDQRDLAWNGGLRFTKHIDGVELWAELTHDVTGVYNGVENKFAARWHEALRHDRFRLGLEGGLVTKSRELVEYYYAPRPDEIHPGLSDYEPHASYSYYTQLDSDYRLTKHVSLCAAWRSARLGHAIADSPLSGKSRLDSWFLGLKVLL